MPGLLDFANTDDGMQGLGLLSAAAPMMAPMNLAGRLAMAAQGYQGMKADAMKRQEAEQELMMKQVQFQQAQSKWGVIQPIMQLLANGISGAPQAGASAGTSTAQSDMPRSPSVMRLPGVPNMIPEQSEAQPQPSSQPGRFPLNFNQVTALKMASGLDLSKEFEIGQTGYEQKPGSWYAMPNGEMRYVDDLKSGMKYDPKTGTMSPLGGYAESMARQEGMKTTAVKAAETRFTPLSPEYKDTEGRPLGGSIGSYLGGDASAPSAAPSSLSPAVSSTASLGKIPANVQAGRDAESYRMIKQEYDTERDPVQKAAMGRELMNLSVKAQKSGVKLQSTSEAAQDAARVALENQPALKSATDIAGGDAKNFTDYKSTLNKSVETGYQQYQRNQEIEQLMQSYKTGLPNPEARSAFASTLKNTFPNNSAIRKFAEGVNGGDIGNGQMLANLLSSASLTNVIRTLDGNGRINKAEFQALQEHAEKNRTDPDALLGIMRYQNNAFKNDYAEQQALATAEKGPGANPKTWQADYQKTRMDNLAAPGALPATPSQVSAKTLPVATSGFTASVNGKTYTFPNQKALANFKLEAGIK